MSVHPAIAAEVAVLSHMINTEKGQAHFPRTYGVALQAVYVTEVADAAARLLTLGSEKVIVLR